MQCESTLLIGCIHLPVQNCKLQTPNTSGKFGVHNMNLMFFCTVPLTVSLPTEPICNLDTVGKKSGSPLQ